MWSLFETNDLYERRRERMATAEEDFLRRIQAQQARLRPSTAEPIQTVRSDEDVERTDPATA